MILLDEHLGDPPLAAEIARWCRSRVCCIAALEGGRGMGDDVIPSLLRRLSQPTFITLNVSDFWLRLRADSSFCIVCMEPWVETGGGVSRVLRRLFAVPQFSSTASRMGKIVTLRRAGLLYYEFPHQVVHAIPWPDA